MYTLILWLTINGYKPPEDSYAIVECQQHFHSAIGHLVETQDGADLVRITNENNIQPVCTWALGEMPQEMRENWYKWREMTDNPVDM